MPASAAPPAGAAAQPPLTVAPVSLTGRQRGSIVVTPQRLIAPVGSEVIIKAGLCRADGRYATDQRIQWALSQESVGHLVAVGDDGQRRFLDRFCGAEPRAQRDASFAEGRTSSQNRVLRRNTPEGPGNVQVLSGQTWVSVSSLAEGVSRVAAMAPDAPQWDGRSQTAVIEWIDAQWSAPAPAIVRSGEQHTLTTQVTRSTDGTPLVGWIVRYETLEGPPAEFVSYEGTSGVAADATTDSNGQASVTISPKSNAAGATRVRIQIMRPPSPDSSRTAVVVGDAYTSVTWSAPGLSANIIGPQQVTAGETATYHIEVTNPGDMPVTGVNVTHVLPPEMSFLGSDPPGQVFGNRVEWGFPVIEPGMVMAIDLSCRADGGGDVAHLVTVDCAEGLAAEASTVTRVFENGLSIRMSGPVTAQVGEQVTFDIAVTNVGNRRLTNVMAADELSRGLAHESGVPRIERPLGDLGPGETVEFAVTLTVTQPGEICHSVTAAADGGHFAATRACVAASTPAPPPAPEAPAPPQPSPEPAYTLRVDGPEAARIGQIVEFTVVATNTGGVPLTNVRLTSAVDEQLTHVFAQPGFFPMAGGIYWNLPQLPVGHRVVVRVQARCDAAGANICHRATVDCDQLDPKNAQACINIHAQGNQPQASSETSAPGRSVLTLSPARSRSVDSRRETNEPANGVPGREQRTRPGGSLKVHVAPLAASVLVGDSVTCVVEVHNDRDVADHDVQLTLQLPASLRYECLLDGPVERRSTSQEGRNITFTPVREIRPGERLAFRVRLRSQQSGRPAIRAKVTSRRRTQPVEADAVVRVN